MVLNAMCCIVKELVMVWCVIWYVSCFDLPWWCALNIFFMFSSKEHFLVWSDMFQSVFWCDAPGLVMVRCDGHGRLRQQDDWGPEQDAGRDGREGGDTHRLGYFFAMALYLLLKVGMLFRFIATGIGGFVYPFTQVKIHCGIVKLILLSCSFSELASLPCSSNCGSGDGCDGWNHWQDHDSCCQGWDGHLWKGATNRFFSCTKGLQKALFGDNIKQFVIELPSQ